MYLACFINLYFLINISKRKRLFKIELNITKKIRLPIYTDVYKFWYLLTKRNLFIENVLIVKLLLLNLIKIRKVSKQLFQKTFHKTID